MLWVLGVSSWRLSSLRSSAPVWTGCRRSLSSRQSPADSTCGSPWSASGWRNSRLTVSGMTQGLIICIWGGREERGGESWVQSVLDDSPGEHVTGFFHLVTGNVMLHIWFVYPGLHVDDLLPVVIRHGRAVDFVCGRYETYKKKPHLQVSHVLIN